MNTHSQILVIGHDQMLLQTRRLILGTYFEVESAGRVSEAGSILSRQDFDLIVLCDTLNEDECHRIEGLAHTRKPSPDLLTIIGPGNGYRQFCTGRRLECGAGPLRLLRECAEILGCELQNRNKALVM